MKLFVKWKESCCFEARYSDKAFGMRRPARPITDNRLYFPD